MHGGRAFRSKLLTSLGGGQHLPPNDLRSLVPPNLDHWHPPLTNAWEIRIVKYNRYLAASNYYYFVGNHIKTPITGYICLRDNHFNSLLVGGRGTAHYKLKSLRKPPSAWATYHIQGIQADLSYNLTSKQRPQRKSTGTYCKWFTDHTFIYVVVVWWRFRVATLSRVFTAGLFPRCLGGGSVKFQLISPLRRS